jgi:hypothetical protein
VSEQAAIFLTRALEKELAADDRRDLAQGLAALAGRMEPAEAARLSRQAASILIRALEKETNAWGRKALAEGLAAVAVGLDPAEAARLSWQAARVISLPLEKKIDANDRRALAQGLAAVVGRLSLADAAAFCHPSVYSLLQAVETASDEEDRQILAMAMAELLPASDGIHASGVSARTAFLVCSGRKLIGGISWTEGDSSAGGNLGIWCLDALLTDDSRSEVSRRTVAVATAVGLACPMPFPALTALPPVSKPLPCRLSTQDLVELLKMPTCFGEARKVVLKHLGNRYGRYFADHWEFVRFAQEQHLDLDLQSPAKRAARGALPTAVKR